MLALQQGVWQNLNSGLQFRSSSSFPFRTDNPMKRLTAKQQTILSYIRVYRAKTGFSPTVREIASAFGIRSTNGVSDHLKALEQKGRLKRLETMPRGIEVIEKMRIQFCGDVT